MFKTLLRTIAILILVGILIFKLTRNSISIGIGASTSCTNDTHCVYAGAVSLSDKNILSLTTAGSATLDNIHVKGKATIAGALKATQGTFGSLLANGATTLDTITINNHAHINGSLKSTKGTYGSLSVYGGATLSSITVTGDTTSAGAFRATDSTFSAISAARGSHITLTNSTASSITITKGHTDKLHPIELDASIIKGNIEFEEKDGTVILRNGAQVTGEVIGGAIITN